MCLIRVQLRKNEVYFNMLQILRFARIYFFHLAIFENYIFDFIQRITLMVSLSHSFSFTVAKYKRKFNYKTMFFIKIIK